jgi:cell division protein FtsI/penicillin-binding protein 2
VQEFLVGWEAASPAGYAAAARRTDGDPATVRRALSDAVLHLDADSLRFSLKGMTSDGDRAQARFHAVIDLGENNNPPWEYDGTLPLRLIDGRWKVHWSPEVLHPKLHEGERFAVITESKGRQPILDRNGDPLQQEQTLYVAGVYPARLKDPVKVCEQLAKVTGFPEDRLLSRIRSAPPKELVQLATFGRARFAQIRDKLQAIPGIKTLPDRQPVAPAPPTQIIGQVNAVTPETEQLLGGPQRAGDTVGRNGLQKAYQDQLTSSTETRVVTLDEKTGEQVAELASWPGRANTPVRTTIDRRVQAAAESAVAGAGPVALVAVKASTGEVLAVSTENLHQERDALAGKYPAGTAYSIIAAGGLLKAGIDPKRKVPCTADRSVGGARFQQQSLANGATAAGTTPSLAADFARGCVTALASTARLIGGDALADTAERFGIGSPWTLPLRSFSGWAPDATSDAEKARVIVGQTVKVSPLSMALVAGAIASGTWHAPKLVTSPASTDPDSDAPPPAGPAPVELDPDVTGKLRSLLRLGVTSGTARPAASGKDPVYGVASVVGYTDKKQHVDLSWFVGWQGDLAVAVMAQKNDPQGASAIAGTFFTAARPAP